MVDYEHALNFWRSVFANKTEIWDKNDFDEWFWRGEKAVIFDIIRKEEEGSPKHFDQVIRESFIAMLKACARGDFSKE